MGGVVFLGLLFLVIAGQFDTVFPYVYLIPWIIGLFILLMVPTTIYYRKGTLTLANPLMLATWSYFFPAFVIGGLMVAFGFSHPYFLTYIQDPRTNIPFSMFLVMLGYGSLAFGFMSPLGKWAGMRLQRYLPNRDFDPEALYIPGMVLLVIGFTNSTIAFFSGVFGFQKAVEIEAYDGLLSLLTVLWMQGTFLLLYIVFKTRRLSFLAVISLLLVTITALGRALLAGNRGSFLQVFMIVMLAFLLAGRRLTAKQTVISGMVLVVCLMVGMLYGSTFRYLKGNESVVSASSYADSIGDTFAYLGREGSNNLLRATFENLAERLDALSSVALVVSTYEQLAPYEESYGLQDNIWNELTTFFVPRIIWPNKPIAADARKFSDLYFNHAENSFAATPITDLLRNFGWAGIVLGMFFLGFVLRLIYRTFIEDQPKSILRAGVFFLMLITVSYEAFYGNILTYMIKVGITAVFGIVIVYLIARAIGKVPRRIYI